MNDRRRFLVVLRDDRSLLEKMRIVLAELRKCGPAELVFTEEKGSIAGIYVKSILAVGQISARVDTLVTTKDRGFILIFELGEDYAFAGGSAGWRHVLK